MPRPSFQMELTCDAIPAHGDLGSIPFALFLARARLLGATGILSLLDQKRIFLARGLPVHVESTLAESSGLYLRHDAADEGDFEPSPRLSEPGRRRLDETLLGLGSAKDHDHRFEHSHEHARESILACFGWESGAVQFDPCESFCPNVLPLSHDIIRLFLDGFRLHYDAARLSRELPIDDTSRLYGVASPRAPVDAASVGAVDTRLLELAETRASLQSVGAEIALDTAELHRHLYLLYCLGFVGFEVDAAVYASGEARPIDALHPPPLERSEPPPDTTQGSLQPPPLARFSPSANLETASTQSATTAAARNSEPTHRPPTRATGPLAHRLEALASARRIDPRNPAVAAEMALVLLLMDPRSNARVANRLAREARTSDASLPLPYVVMGILMEQLRDADRAAQLYRYALRQDPRCREAQRRLAVLESQGLTL